MTGWGYDPNYPAVSVNMQLVVNGVAHTVPANQWRADVDRVYRIPGNHGFQAVVAGKKGVNHVDLYATGVPGIQQRLISSFNMLA
jgi:hypothetical protein